MGKRSRARFKSSRKHVLLVEHGALYAALQQLKAQGWITAEPIPSLRVE